MHKLVLIRHGQSTWNLENRFTGWGDVDLTKQGVSEARTGARAIRDAGLSFDIAHTSLLKRAIRTLWLVLDELDLMWIPVERSWRLNERHYGALQGLNKAETAAKHGDAQVKIWRRSFATAPPEIEPSDERFPGHDPRYHGIPDADLPRAEALKHTIDRVLPYWNQSIAPEIKAGKRLMIVAHGNSLRALVKYLDDLSEAEIMEFNIPTGVPLVYDLDANLKPISREYLGDPEAIKAAAAAVAAQGSAKG